MRTNKAKKGVAASIRIASVLVCPTCGLTCSPIFRNAEQYLFCQTVAVAGIFLFILSFLLLLLL